MTRTAPCPPVDLEYVPPGRCPAMPPDNAQRWAARQELYNAVRNTEAKVVPIRTAQPIRAGGT